MATTRRRYSKEEFARRGDAIYDRDLRPVLEPGRNGEFALYDDAGEGFGYEKGEYSLIHIKWNDRRQTLSLAARDGSFPGMDGRMRIKIRCGSAPTIAWDLVYSGAASTVRIPGCR